MTTHTFIKLFTYLIGILAIGLATYGVMNPEPKIIGLILLIVVTAISVKPMVKDFWEWFCNKTGW